MDEGRSEKWRGPEPTGATCARTTSVLNDRKYEDTETGARRVPTSKGWDKVEEPSEDEQEVVGVSRGDSWDGLSDTSRSIRL